MIEPYQWSELRTRAQTGHAIAQWELGYCYEFGTTDTDGNVLCAVDPVQACEWYVRAAQQGNSAAQSALSRLLSGNDGVERDFAAAIHWAKKAVAQGDASAAHNLGTIYRDQKKLAMAYRWYARAAAMGSTDSLLQVALCCLFGVGTTTDHLAAQHCLKQIVAAEPETVCQRTKEDALYWLAILRLLGLGNSKKSLTEIRTMLEMANADDDHEQANELLNIIGKSKYLLT